jgi:hypothetical protein
MASFSKSNFSISKQVEKFDNFLTSWTLNVRYVAMSIKNTQIHELLMLCSQYWHDMWYEPFMERKNTNSHVHIWNSETFSKWNSKYAMFENTKQILMILTHGKVIHPYINI